MVEGEALRAAMRLWTTGVTVVTTAFEGSRAGVTANSFTSVSLNPPLVLFCLQKLSETYPLLEKSGVFGISVLGEGQSAISDQFAGFTKLPEGEDRFYQIDTFTAESGVPILSAAIAWFDCRLHALYDGSTHHIVVGEVTGVGRSVDPAQPLVYFNRAYRNILP